MTDDVPLGYANGPLDELVIGVQFSSPVISESAILSRLWSTFRDEFPSLEIQPAVPPFEETFVSPEEFEPGAVEQQIFVGPSMPQRFWFASQDERRLVQVQSDRVLVNWRKRDDTDAYPRFDEIGGLFDSRLDDLYAAVREADGEEPHASLCEVTYINIVDAESGTGGAAGRRPLSDFLTMVRDVNPLGTDSVEETSLQQAYVIADSDSRPVGRLRVSAAPGLRASDRRRIFAVHFSVRLRPESPDREGVSAAVSRAHQILRSNFEVFTTAEAQASWRSS